ncbi:hypothetical protein GCM10010452_44750 [Crossiella cryophila]
MRGQCPLGQVGEFVPLPGDLVRGPGQDLDDLFGELHGLLGAAVGDEVVQGLDHLVQPLPVRGVVLVPWRGQRAVEGAAQRSHIVELVPCPARHEEMKPHG